MVQFTEMVMHKTSPTLVSFTRYLFTFDHHQLCHSWFSLLNLTEQHNFAQSVIYGLGAGVGFSLVLVLFSSIRERLAASDVPLPFKGASIAMITAGLMSLAFMGFTGLIK